MVDAYWRVGREIVEVEQHGRARYGEEVIARLATRLTRRFGKGFSAQNLRRMRQFGLVFPAGSTIRSGLLSKLGEAPQADSLRGTDRPQPLALTGVAAELVDLVDGQRAPTLCGGDETSRQ